VDTAKRCVELFLAHQEGIVLGGDLPAGLGEIQRDPVVGSDNEEVREAVAAGKPRMPVRNTADCC
jgi:hypothetical protein